MRLRVTTNTLLLLCGVLVLCSALLGMVYNALPLSLAATESARHSRQWHGVLRASNGGMVLVQHAKATLKDANDSPHGSRGIVMCVHDGILALAVSLIRELRCLGNQEPIHVYHCFPDELSQESQDLLTRNNSNVQIVDVCVEMMEQNQIIQESVALSFKSYWIKPLALYHTKLTEVLLLDADAVFLKDPASLRTLAGYQRTGTMFFYDRLYNQRKYFNTRMKDPRDSDKEQHLLKHIIETFDYKRFGLSGVGPSEQLLNSMAYREQTSHEQDSSVVAINKAKAGKAMEILKYLITIERFNHVFSWGDKEAFWLAYELAHEDYYFSPWGLSLLNSVPNQDLENHPDTLCGSMAHYVPVDAESTEAPEVLYVNGKALLDPFPLGVSKSLKTHKGRMFSIHPTHLTPRYRRAEMDLTKAHSSFQCLKGLGSTTLPSHFRVHLMRRRVHYLAVQTQYFEPLDRCIV
uniref:Nucleotide-diphospho-sugar transferase domain-containing protein n=1 Tax=Globisporangium ultimum (strain ATCC 200006 / CBS 805.95 / DAOM BR144) TaxID=431595 RepID=K3XAB5_GLOUD